MDDVEDVSIEWRDKSSNDCKNVFVAGNFSNWNFLSMFQDDDSAWKIR